MRTNVYIDGFNLYYGRLKNTPYKWLDPKAMAQLIFPEHTIHRIRYFTAHVRAPANDPQKPQRQLTYLRALQTIPHLSIHYGMFLSHIVKMPLAKPTPGGPLVEVIRMEEKGSDVNLATHLLVDGFRKDYEMAVVVSNDSDLMAPIRQVRQLLGLRVSILNPQRDKGKTSWSLMRSADCYRRIRTGMLRRSLLPDKLADANGTIRKPQGW